MLFIKAFAAASVKNTPTSVQGKFYAKQGNTMMTAKTRRGRGVQFNAPTRQRRKPGLRYQG